MSFESLVDTVPNVVHTAITYGVSTIEDNDYCKLLEPEAWAENYDSDEFEKDPMHFKVEVRNWRLNSIQHTGAHSKLYGWEWVHKLDGSSVILINESAYSDVGDHEVAVVAEDEASIKQFLSDFVDLVNCDAPVVMKNGSVRMSVD